ncbi:protein NO VEIN domain-containing protein [Candidatus Leptofilum sp.]|uniref:protein NO VEIN domain-containing protein n=1 Tax=Candidatus Leptofilum sp. TaxID=3241576 RepID=UPI003B5ACB13
MAFPKYSEIQIPLLIEIKKRGGSVRPSAQDKQGRTVYKALADYFDLGDIERAILVKEGSHDLKWNNMVRWARNDLRKLNYIDGSKDGVWTLSEQGEEFLRSTLQQEIEEGNSETEYVISPREFAVVQEKNLEIGELGEEFVLETERKNLLFNSKPALAKKVKQISKENVAAGYDILSFDTEGREKYIEVKTSRGNRKTFELTRNEREKARELGDSYWLYKVTDVETEPKLEMFQNPSQLIENGVFVLRATTWQVMLGEKS